MAGDLSELSRRLRAHVEALAACPRPPGSSSHQKARAYIHKHLDQAGFPFREQRSRLGGPECINVLTDPWPADDRLPLLIVGAHYDSVETSPGADDNASAVAALLELARWLGPRRGSLARPTGRIQLVAYDQEEFGLVGSGVHSLEIARTGLPYRGMIALEMLGFLDPRPGSQGLPMALRGMYPTTGTFIGVIGNQASADLLGRVAAGLRRIPDLPVEAMAVPETGQVLPETRLSDHSSFWDQGLPAVMITDTSFFRNPHYHEPTDTPDTLDYTFLAQVTAGLCLAVWELLSSPVE